MSMNSDVNHISAYDDTEDTENMADVFIGDYGYKYRLLEDLVVPPYVTPERYQLARSIKLRPDDICYGSYPKSGSTWLAHILVLVTNNGEPPAEGTLRSRLHWVESSWPYPRTREEIDNSLTPRIFKSHMPVSMALGGDPSASDGKYIYIARNPKDVAVSYYHFESEKAWSGNYNGPWDHWLEMLIAGKVQRGSWFDHVLGWWEKRHLDNVLFLKYEEMLQNFPEQLNRIIEFLGYDLSTTAREEICRLTAFEVMKKDKFSNMHEIDEFEGFFRRGKIGSWEDQFTSEQDKMFSEMISTRLAGTGLDFEYK